MSESNWMVLRQQFFIIYDDLRKRLTQRFGSAELAADALQDTFVRLERGGALDKVDNPTAYISRMAANIAHNLRRIDARRLNSDEAEAIFASAEDDAPDAFRILAGREAFDVVRAVIATLPARRRDIFVAVFVDGIPQATIARRLGISVRRVQKESQAAREAVRHALSELIRSGDFELGRNSSRRVSSR